MPGTSPGVRHASPTWVQRARRFAVGTAQLASVGLAAACVLAFLPIWPLALLEHFRLQLVLLGVVATAGAAALRIRGYVDAAAITTLIQLLWIAPDVCRDRRAVPVDGIPLRVLILNVHTESTGYSDVRRLIEELHPDVIGLVEVSPRWLAEVEPPVGDYPGRLVEPRIDNFGVALFARRPLTGTIETFGAPVPSAVAELDLDGTHLSLVLVHPPPPASSDLLATQRDLLDAVADLAWGRESVVVMGDFNATPWSRPFRRFATRSGLCDSRAGFGLESTFPAWSSLLRIPIDHLFASCTIGVRDRWVERDVGSDHLPVVVDVVIPRAR
jgi:endonuclease/exonuclease/phosphatase (EEP) superfamily protein YafD